MGAGLLAKSLGGVTPIPQGTNLALGFSRSLDEFATSKNAVSIMTAWDKGFHKVPMGNIYELKQFFGDITSTFVRNGGRIKFNLSGLRSGMEGATTWELRQVLKSARLKGVTDFYLDGKRLTGDALAKALGAWL